MRPFAQFYDLLFAHKIGADDAAVFERLAGSLTDRKVLEVGAGTGRVTSVLTDRAASVTAAEIDPDFFALLKDRMAQSANASLSSQPIDRLDDGDFDAAAAFFHVLNYIERPAMPPFLEALAARLKPGAPFVADFWCAETVLADPPRMEIRRTQVDGHEIERVITPTLDAKAMAVDMHYAIEIKRNEEFTAFEERLRLTLWPMTELNAFLRAAGFATMDWFDARGDGPPAATDRTRWLRARRA